jgi:hypothetical protein
MRIAPFTFCGFHRSLTKIIRGKMHDVNRKNFINTIGVRSAPFSAPPAAKKRKIVWYFHNQKALPHSRQSLFVP